MLKYKGSIVIVYYAQYIKDGVSYPAYCLDKTKTGVSDGLSYSVSVENAISDVKLWRIITNGYPYKTIQELGCANKEEAFTATKQAIYCVLLDRDISLYRGKTERGKELVKAIKELKDIGMDESIPAQPQANLSTYKVGGFVEDGEYYSQTYGVTSTANIYEYEVEE